MEKKTISVGANIYIYKYILILADMGTLPGYGRGYSMYFNVINYLGLSGIFFTGLDKKQTFPSGLFTHKQLHAIL